MNNMSKFLALGLAGALLVSGAAIAGSKPSGSKNASASIIKKEYSGKTWKWDGGGGIYFATGGKVSILYKKAVGIGTWSAKSGGICYKATWHWDDKGAKSKKVSKCWKHVVDKEGVLWAKEDKKNNWYEASKYNKISSGNRINSKFNRLKKKLGI